MTTPRSRAAVSVLSFAAALVAPLALGACAGAAAPASYAAGIAPAPSPTIEFENEAEVRVDVYLVTDRQQWRLGRVAPGARMQLSIPEAALKTGSGWAQLATIADAPPTVLVARDPRATLTMAQPVSELLTQRWSFRSPGLGSARLLGAYGRGGRGKVSAVRQPVVADASNGRERPR